MLHLMPTLRLLPIVRHPGAVMNSWIKNPREFPPDADVRREWRFGGCKNQGREEDFFGYYKWKELAHMYLDLRDQFPERVHIVHYEELVDHAHEESRKVFDFLRLEVSASTTAFIDASHQRHVDSPYAVFRSPDVRDRWRGELPSFISETIERDLTGTRLEVFIR
jgi:hypothetical protein